MRRLLGACAASLATVASVAGAADAATPKPCGTVVLPSGLGMSTSPGTAATFHPILLTGSLYENQPSLMMYLPLLWYGGVGRIDWSRSLASMVAANSDDTARLRAAWLRCSSPNPSFAARPRPGPAGRS